MVALFFALGGTAIAARHYLITSTRQIKPSVLKALKGNRVSTGPQGPQGLQGLAGTPGAAGGKGERGEPGPMLAALPSGSTERGSYGFAGTRAKGGFAPGTVTSYPIPLSFTPTIYVIKVSGSPTANCPGSVESPTAVAGSLCIYEERETTELDAENHPANGHFGFLAFTEAAEGANYELYGTWAVTAP